MRGNDENDGQTKVRKTNMLQFSEDDEKTTTRDRLQKNTCRKAN